jgi:prolyl oligopeptidase
MKIISIVIALVIGVLFLNSCSSGTASPLNSTPATNTFNYPATATVTVINNYFGTLISDPYQWLESTTATNVLSWVDQQNTFTQNYFTALPNYAQIVTQINTIYGVSSSIALKPLRFNKLSKTIVKAKGVYFYQINKENEGRTEHKTIPALDKSLNISLDNIIYTTDNPNKPGRVFIDLNKMFPDDIITTTGITTFDNDKYLVTAISRNYGDLSDLIIINIATKTQVTTISNTFGNVNAWQNGFFYAAPRDVTNPLLSPYNNNSLNFFSMNAEGQANDTVTVYSGESRVLVGVNYLDTANSKLYFSTSIDTTNNLYRVDLTADTWQPEVFIDDGFQHSFNILNIESGQVLITTNSGARRLRLISVDANNPEPQNWQNVLPETGSQTIINGIYNCGNKYIADSIDSTGASLLAQYNQDGSFENEIALPGTGAVGLSSTSCVNENSFKYTYSNLVTPTNYIDYDPLTGTGSTYNTIEVATFTPANYVMTQASVPSTDGAVVNIFLAYKQGLQLNSQNPAYIYVYGGFDSPVLPTFDRRAVFFLENGGVYVVAQVRGGGEQGTSWYNDGRLLKKQNTFNDTIAVAQYLINNGYTNAGKLGLGGRSNGGLTTAAVALQRPDLFQVAFPAVGVLDLLRYNLFTYGFSWYYDYGFSSNQEEFNNMLAFSPLQNVHAQVYPAMYIQTGQQDSRVPPLHSYKFAATLQNVAKNGPNPYLLDSYPNLSHFPETMDRLEAARTWAFFFANTNSQLLTQ